MIVVAKSDVSQVCYRLAMSATDRAPSLVLLPGTLCDRRVFVPLLKSLERSGVRMPGVQFLDTHRALTLMEAARQVLAAAPPEFLLLGFSLGGLVALQVALLDPARILGLALLGTKAGSVDPAKHPARRAQVLWAREHGTGRLLGERLWPACVSPANLSDVQLRTVLIDMADSLGLDAFDAQTELALTRPDLRSSLRSLPMPSLVLGGGDDVINPPSVQQELADGLGNATLAMIEGAGHFMLLEDPDAVAAHVAAWMHTIAQLALEFK